MGLGWRLGGMECVLWSVSMSSESLVKKRSQRGPESPLVMKRTEFTSPDLGKWGAAMGVGCADIDGVLLCSDV